MQDQNSTEDLKIAMEEQRVLEDVKWILNTKQGRSFMKYLFECFEVGTLPERGLPIDFLREQLGFLKAGNSVYKFVAIANPEIASSILATIERERHVQTIHAAQAERSRG